MSSHEAHEIAAMQKKNIAIAEKLLDYKFKNKQLIASAITHPSAIEGGPVQYSYERLEFLGDALLGAIVSASAFKKYPGLDEGGLTRIKVSLVSGSMLSEVSQSLGFEKIIVFGHSETGTHGRGMQSALENVYEAIIAALYLDDGIGLAESFIERTLIPKMDISMAQTPTNPKSELQERLQEDGITPVYKIIDTQGPPHDRTFVSQVYAGDHALAQGSGRSKKEAESQAAKSTLARLSEFLGFGLDAEAKAQKEEAQAKARAKKAAEKEKRETANREEQAARKAKKAQKAAQKEARANKTQQKPGKEQDKKRAPVVWESDLEKVRSNSAREAEEAARAKEAKTASPRQIAPSTEEGLDRAGRNTKNPEIDPKRKGRR